MNLEKLFDPKSIAIVGATDEDGKVGTAVCNNILNLGYEGKVFLVNPKHENLFEKDCYPSLEAIREPIDLAIIAIPARFVSQVIQNGGDSVKNFVIISAGFSEIGEEGEKLEQEISKIAKEKDLNILGPNCLGFIIPKLKLNASFASGLPKKGNISFVSQSGALISAILDISKTEGFGFSNIISIGNKMQIDESDLFEYLENDSETKVIGMYLEGIKDVKKFIELAKKTSREKPIVILKAGKTEKSKQAITSHTGALAGSEDIIKAIFRKTGIIQADNFDKFINLLKIISFSNAPLNENTAIVTNAGGPGVLTTDAFFGKEIKLSEISDEDKKQLKEFLPKESSLENPIDLLGDAQEDRYEKTLKIIEKEDIGSIVSILTPQENTPVEKITEKIIELRNRTNKNISTVFLGGERIKKSAQLLNNSGVPDFSSPEKAISAINAYYLWNKNRDLKVEITTDHKSGQAERRVKVGNIIKKVRKDIRTALFFSEAKEIMDTYEINTVRFQEISLKEDLEIEFPLVLKLDSDKVFHKTDKDAVILKIKNEEELKTAYQKISSAFPGEKIIIQPMEDIESELIMGIKRDELAGSVVVFGLGGTYTEIFKLVDFVIPPADINEIKNIVWSSPVGFLFRKTRGQDPYDLEEVSEVLLKLTRIAEEITEIKELDINPLLIYNDGRKALAVDVKIII